MYLRCADIRIILILSDNNFNKSSLPIFCLYISYAVVSYAIKVLRMKSLSCVMILFWCLIVYFGGFLGDLDLFGGT